ncbi:MAG: hypothetical protein KF851_18010 [Pirellulaceae bacterium]|nr:hypothetical protein [Pirellulaceae bacterium]
MKLSCVTDVYQGLAAAREILIRSTIVGIVVWRVMFSGELDFHSANSLQAGQNPPGLNFNTEKSSSADELAQLAAAVQANPSDLAARGTYAQALYRAGNLPEAWLQLLAGYQLDPNHSGMIRGIQDLVAEFTKRDLFTVGVPAETLTGVLGEPHQVVEMPWGKRFVYAFMAADFRQDKLHEIIDLRGVTKIVFEPTEIVAVDLDGRGWSTGYREKTKASSKTMLFVPGESVSNWNEMITVERIIGGTKAGSMEEIANLAIKQMSQSFPQSQQLLIEVSEESAIIAFEGIGPQGQTTIHQLVRLLRGPEDIHRIAYSLRSDTKPSVETQKKWLEIFQSAKLRTL